MKLQTLTKTLTIGLIGVGAALTVQSPSQAQTRFECLVPVTGPYIGIPTTFVQSGPNEYRAVIRWSSDYFSGSGYTPMRRCEEVTGRFNSLNSRPGGIGNINTGYLNGEPVIYVSSSGRERANSANLLFTLKRGDDARQKLAQLFGLRQGASSSPLFESSSDSATIDFSKFLESVPVETNPATGSSSSPAPGTSPEQSPQKPSGGSAW